jgi:molybdenum cofactor cytidylyltransferase
MTPAAILLAAGPSSRMGRSKQMLDIDGQQLLIKTTRTFLDAGVSPLIVVLGSDEKAHKALLTGHPVAIVSNSNWQSGMGTSLKAGLTHLLSVAPSSQAVILSVCDQPLLSSDLIRELIKTYYREQKKIVASLYSGEPGVPALFDAAYFEKLASLPDNQGAKKLILENPSDAAVVPFPGGEIDLDTMQDYERFIKRNKA